MKLAEAEATTPSLSVKLEYTLHLSAGDLHLIIRALRCDMHGERTMGVALADELDRLRLRSLGAHGHAIAKGENVV